MKPFSRNLSFTLFVGLSVFISSAFLLVSELAQYRIQKNFTRMDLATEATVQLWQLEASTVEADREQRDFLQTGRGEYLAAYKMAHQKAQSVLLRLQQLWQKNSQQLDNLALINTLVGQRLGELDASLVLYGAQGKKSASDLVRSNLGQQTNRELRRVIQRTIDQEAGAYNTALTSWSSDVMLARAGMAVLTGVNFILLLLLYSFSQRKLNQGIIEVQNAEDRQQELERMIAERTAILSSLSSSLQTQQEREKAKIARNIHDELGSAVISARMDVTYVLTQLRDTEPALAEPLERAIQSLDNTVDIKRRLIEELRPSVLDTLGLVAAIEWQTQEVCQRAELDATLDLQEVPEMPELTVIALFRIVQEALTNIVKYAKATRVNIALRPLEDGWTLVIQDNGVGLAEGAVHNPLSHGIAGMRQRVAALNGRFSISSDPGEGVLIHVHVPRPPLLITSDGQACDGDPVPQSSI